MWPRAREVSSFFAQPNCKHCALCALSSAANAKILRALAPAVSTRPTPHGDGRARHLLVGLRLRVQHQELVRGWRRVRTLGERAESLLCANRMLGVARSEARHRLAERRPQEAVVLGAFEPELPKALAHVDELVLLDKRLRGDGGGIGRAAAQSLAGLARGLDRPHAQDLVRVAGRPAHLCPHYLVRQRPEPVHKVHHAVPSVDLGGALGRRGGGTAAARRAGGRFAASCSLRPLPLRPPAGGVVVVEVARGGVDARDPPGGQLRGRAGGPSRPALLLLLRRRPLLVAPPLLASPLLLLAVRARMVAALGNQLAHALHSNIIGHACRDEGAQHVRRDPAASPVRRPPHADPARGREGRDERMVAVEKAGARALRGEFAVRQLADHVHPRDVRVATPTRRPPARHYVVEDADARAVQGVVLLVAQVHVRRRSLDHLGGAKLEVGRVLHVERRERVAVVHEEGDVQRVQDDDHAGQLFRPRIRSSPIS
mmetsp:Transcript_48161/g.160521  ORF Transcript_48161/g.160521 Transcript_48161/m.160521 type:complete len:486 (+) Transcript_48161:171-1628(+)